MERQRWIDIYKGIAIILVVIGHVVTSYHNSGLFTESLVFNYVGDNLCVSYALTSY